MREADEDSGEAVPVSEVPATASEEGEVKKKKKKKKKKTAPAEENYGMWLGLKFYVYNKFNDNVRFMWRIKYIWLSGEIIVFDWNILHNIRWMVIYQINFCIFIKCWSLWILTVPLNRMVNSIVQALVCWYAKILCIQSAWMIEFPFQFTCTVRIQRDQHEYAKSWFDKLTIPRMLCKIRQSKR